MFIASGVGYLLLLAAFVMPALRGLRGVVGALLAVFAIGNIVAWYATGARIPLAYLDKSVEAALLAVLMASAVVSRRAVPVLVRARRQG